MPSFIIALLLAPLLAQNQAAKAPEATGCGPNSVQFQVKTNMEQHTYAPAAPANAVVYVFEDQVRESGVYLGGGVTIRVGVDGQWVGALKGTSYMFFIVAPGEHQVCANRHTALGHPARLTSSASFTAEAGKIYYFRAQVDERNEPQYPNTVTLTRIQHDSEGQYLISTSGYSVSHPKK